MRRIALITCLKALTASSAFLIWLSSSGCCLRQKGKRQWANDCHITCGLVLCCEQFLTSETPRCPRNRLSVLDQRAENGALDPPHHPRSLNLLFWGAPIFFSPEAPKFFEGFWRDLGQKSGAPQKSRSNGHGSNTPFSAL